MSDAHVLILLIHLIATLARLIGPGGARSVVAESLLDFRPITAPEPEPERLR